MGMQGVERNRGTNGWADSCLQSVHLKWPSNYSLGQTRTNTSLHIKVSCINADANHKSLTSKENTLKDASHSCQCNIQASCNLSVMVIVILENWEQTNLRDKVVIWPHLHMHLHHSLDKSWWNKLEQLSENTKKRFLIFNYFFLARNYSTEDFSPVSTSAGDLVYNLQLLP